MKVGYLIVRFEVVWHIKMMPQVLQGSLRETLYDWPDLEAITDGHSSPLSKKKETIYEENEVTYMSDKVRAQDTWHSSRGVRLRLCSVAWSTQDFELRS